jgi:hypothetical protein
MRKRSLLYVGLGAAGLALGGCAANQQVTKPETDYQSQLAQAQAQNAQLQQQLDAQKAASAKDAANPDLFPPNPKPGECYARVLLPATFKTTSQQVEVKPASEQIHVTPAQYDWTTKQVLVKAASKKLVVVPATYKTVTKQVLVQPESKKMIPVAAQYSTTTERVVDVPAHTMWKRGTSTIPGALKSRVDESTGEVLCLVDVPATYKTITKTVLVSPAKVQEVDIPAQYKTVTETVVDQPATTREVDIPAEYRTVRVKEVVTPSQVQKAEVPAEYKTVTSRTKVGDEHLAWRRVVCETNMTSDLAREMQRKLQSDGYYHGRIDGIFGRETMSAASRYAMAHDLPAGTNYVAYDTLQSLGVPQP